MTNAEEHLYEAAKEVEKVKLEGENYKAIDLAKFIIDFEPAELVVDDKIKKMKPKNGYKQEYMEVKKDYLAPNTEQIKKMFKIANKRLEQEQILAG